jgi:hypothetical protein
MALNRLIDAGIDARNPRTAGRELPAGTLRRKDVWLFTAVSVALLVIAALSACVTPPVPGAAPLTSNVVDWRDEIVYQVMIDRFWDGLVRWATVEQPKLAAEQQRDRTDMIRLSGDFHILIGEIAGNSVLLKFLRELVVRESLVIAAYETPGRPSCSNHEHSAILTAIAARDADLAVSRMLEHLDAIAERLDLDRPGKPVVDLAAILA